MLQLKDIKKDYPTGETTVQALKGVSIEFRENEFVSILGQSGCGKTTLLNIIGGLDKYTSGDLIINGKSTKDFSDKDWDTYRNHSIGFVFQSYNLIPHQTVLANVELALTLSGVSPEERKKKAKEVLEKVGLGDQLNKKPNQMSGGQMQRVAIARALVNDPDILLADEPTGALDSQTSVQIMDILKEIAKEKLVVMVTHNPELAKEYSTRIINLLDGRVVHDSDPYSSSNGEEGKVPEDGKNPEGEKKACSEPKKEKTPKKKKKSMSFLTALSLSLNNLLTKKGRTFLTAFAGSIGIIGIALILSVSTGVNSYINSIEQSTMASYPLSIQSNSINMMSIMTSMMEQNESERHDDGYIHSNNVISDMIKMFNSNSSKNNLSKFKVFIESNNDFKNLTNDIKYRYNVNLNTYHKNNDGIYKPTINELSDFVNQLMPNSGFGSLLNGYGSWSELVGDNEFLSNQYDIVSGKLPESPNEVVLIVDDYNRVPDYILYMLGLADMQDLFEYVAKWQIGAENIEQKNFDFTYEQILNTTFKVLTDSQNYKIEDNKIVAVSDEERQALLNSDKTRELKVVGIIRAKEGSSVQTQGTIAYTSSLINSIIDEINESDVVKRITDNENVEINQFTGLPYVTPTMDMVPLLREQMKAATDPSYHTYIDKMSDIEIIEQFSESYEKNLEKVGYVDKSDPIAILIYPKDFEAKNDINDIITKYNNEQKDEDKISYTDTVGLLMSSVTTIVNAISYVLIAFVAISLVVSSIMIGIITYISVLERTKEIGILRSIGASKRDISRVFNAETLIVGFSAGVIGIVITLILNIFVNIILRAVTGIATLSASLPVLGAIILVVISMALTLIAGLIPSRIAAKKDPVIALRTE